MHPDSGTSSMFGMEEQSVLIAVILHFTLINSWSIGAGGGGVGGLFRRGQYAQNEPVLMSCLKAFTC